MVALRLAAGVTADRVRIGRGVDDRCWVVGVAGAGGRQFGQHRFEAGPCFGGQVAADARHAVVFLPADHDAALAGPLLLAELPVGVEPVHDALGVFGQLIGAIAAGFAGQVGFGGLPGGQVHLGGQVGEETADHPHMGVTDQAVTLGGRGGAQLRRHRLTGQRPPRPEIGRFVDAPAGLGLGDTQPVGQRRTQLGAQLGLAGLRAELIDQRMLRCSQSPRRALQTLQGP
ncbi:hypothetical protein LAUMK13_03169 [Mycobacterium innocens]|uniref:Uncharacterized protein n=1 Tax=Mycobacterium innocens TaxID=2341083 RepID=A0A498Q7G9_9MYCO|nr:hypothetical protein LAUMK13_03169 [Mycobacterium innocens]